MKGATININVGHGTRRFLVFVTFVLLSFSFETQAQASREYKIKAVFLYNFTQFVEWPPMAYTSPEAPFVIGILGDDPFHSSIDDVVAGEKVKGHPIVVQRYQNVSEIKHCHILFISDATSGRLREILPALANKNILTVSDIPGFATTGGIIRFMTRENKIKLQINLAASRNADLNISSKLLQVAEIVR